MRLQLKIFRINFLTALGLNLAELSLLLLALFSLLFWKNECLATDLNSPKPQSAPLSGRQIQGPINIEADRLEYNQEKDTYYGYGNVVINFKNGFLLADTVMLDKKTGDTEATGRVFIRDEGDTLEGDKVRFNLNTKTGMTVNGKAFLSENHVYLTGSTIEKRGEQTYFLKDATVTTCDGDHPPWRFTARELDVTVEGYGAIKHGTFQVKDWPILYSPYLVFPAKTKRQSGFLLPTGMNYSDLNGFDIEVPYFWAMSDNMDATFYQRYLQKRGWKEGMEFRYSLSKDSFGTFYSDYLYDSKEITGADDGLFRDWTGHHSRWSYYLNHQTTFSPGFYVRTDLTRVSDHWYFRDFSDNNYYLQNYSADGQGQFKKVSFLGDRSLASLDSTARLVKNWPLYNLTAFTRYTDNLAALNNDTTLQYYPQVTFTGIRQPLFGTPLNFELNSSYLYGYRNEGQKGHVIDISPVVSMPWSFGDYLQLTPSIGVSETKWEAQGGVENNNNSRELYTLGLYGTTEVSRIFPVNIGDLDKLRHIIKPEITYTYRPNVTQNVPDFVSVLPETNAITYALTNFLTARVKEKSGFKYIEFLRLKIAETYNITEVRNTDPTKDQRTFSPITIETDLLPENYVSLRSVMLFDPNVQVWKKLNYDVSLNDKRGDLATIGYHYTQDTLEEINLSLKAKVNREVDVLYALRNNLLDKKTLESTIGIEYRQQCWSALLSYSELNNDRRIMLTFTLLGLGKVGGLQAQPGQLFGRSNAGSGP